jgi:hypothetical protein
MAKAFLDIDIGDADQHASEVAGCDVTPAPSDARTVLLPSGHAAWCTRGDRGHTAIANRRNAQHEA